METTIKIKCPHCSSPMEIEPSWAGMNATCPSCGKDFTIPSQSKPKKKSHTLIYLALTVLILCCFGTAGMISYLIYYSDLEISCSSKTQPLAVPDCKIYITPATHELETKFAELNAYKASYSKIQDYQILQQIEKSEKELESLVVKAATIKKMMKCREYRVSKFTPGKYMLLFKGECAKQKIYEFRIFEFKYKNLAFQFPCD